MLPPKESVPPELYPLKRWLVWRYEDVRGRKTKVPYAPLAPWKKASVRSPETWGSFDEAYRAALATGGGVGIVLGDGLVGVDLDHVLQDGTLEREAREVLARTRTYAEFSPSGEGVHLLVFGAWERGVRRGRIEVYGEGRFFTFTGRVLGNRTRVLKDQRFLRWLEGYLAPSAPGGGGKEEPRPQGAFNPEAFKRIRLSKYADLFLYGSWQGRYRSQSEADLALANFLVFLTQGDLVEADRLFRQSALYRPKWDELRGGKTYGRLTLEKALASLWRSSSGNDG